MDRVATVICQNELPLHPEKNEEGKFIYSFDRENVMDALEEMSKEDFNKWCSEVKALLHHRDSTVGLYAIDEDPSNVINKALYDGTTIIEYHPSQEEALIRAVEQTITNEFKRKSFQIKY